MAQDTQTAEQKAAADAEAAAAQAQADADAATAKANADAEAAGGVGPKFLALDTFDGQPMYRVGGVLVDPHGRRIGNDGKPIGAIPQTDL